MGEIAKELLNSIDLKWRADLQGVKTIMSKSVLCSLASLEQACVFAGILQLLICCQSMYFILVIVVIHKIQSVCQCLEQVIGIQYNHTVPAKSYIFLFI